MHVTLACASPAPAACTRCACGTYVHTSSSNARHLRTRVIFLLRPPPYKQHWHSTSVRVIDAHPTGVRARLLREATLARYRRGTCMHVTFVCGGLLRAYVMFAHTTPTHDHHL